jgi:YfiH family protein
MSELRARLPGGEALFTDRSHGNLSSVGGERREFGENARDALRELICVSRLARGYQVHGTVIARVGGEHAPGAELAHADGQATSVAGVGALVLSADCMPVAIGCEGAVAMVHAGWRGLAAGVLEQGAAVVRELGHGREIEAVIGPCAGARCYEVGPEVHRALGSPLERRGPVDLRAIAHRRLQQAGVGRVSDVSACTICDERFFSHRREGERAGRQAGVAWLS